MSTWGWVIQYGLVALLFLCLSVLVYLWGQDRWVRWQDQRDARRGADAHEPEVDPKP